MTALWIAGPNAMTGDAHVWRKSNGKVIKSIGSFYPLFFDRFLSDAATDPWGFLHGRGISVFSFLFLLLSWLDGIGRNGRRGNNGIGSCSSSSSTVVVVKYNPSPFLAGSRPQIPAPFLWDRCVNRSFCANTLPRLKKKVCGRRDNFFSTR